MKISAGLWKKIYKAYREGHFLNRVRSKLSPYNPLSYFKFLKLRKSVKSISLHCPEYVEPNKSEKDVVERIFSSYRKMKEDQKKVRDVYLPSSLWQKQLDEAYDNLNAGLREDNLDKFHFFLANFGAWKIYTGVESSTFVRDNMKSYFRRLYLKYIFLNQLKIWQWFYNGRKDISQLSYPVFGNQVGAYINGSFVGLGSFFNEIYGSILASLIAHIKRPVIGELGGGYGKLAYFTLRNSNNYTYINFDLPEAVCLAAYYLIQAFPNKKALLYGEEKYSSDVHKDYDLILMPCWEMENIGKNTVDLFINKNSLGEMTKKAVKNYVHYICSSSQYFFHMNHEIFPNIYQDNERGLLGYEYPVPSDKFKLLFRYPDIGHLLSQGYLDYSMDIFIYLYEKI